jgi:hypothetical protein
MTGRYIKTLASQIVDAGEQQISFDASDLRQGLYIYRIQLNYASVASAKLMKW